MNATNEWYDVVRLTDGSYRITEAERYGVFLIEGTDRSVLLDAGIGVGDLYGLVTDLVETPITLVLTHTHWDHIGAAAQFDDVRVHPAELPPDGRIAIDSLSPEFVDRPSRFTDRWATAERSFPDEFEPDEYRIDPAPASELSTEKPIDLGERTLEVVALPGHSPGHVGLLDPERGTLYAGDVLHFEYGLYVHFEDCDLEDYIASLRRVRELWEAGTIDRLRTSHNEPLSGTALSIVDDLLVGLQEIADGTRDYELVETDWGPARSYEIGDVEVLTGTDV